MTERYNIIVRGPRRERRDSCDWGPALGRASPDSDKCQDSKLALTICSALFTFLLIIDDTF